jgi:hypothetical protein
VSLSERSDAELLEISELKIEQHGAGHVILDEAVYDVWLDARVLHPHSYLLSGPQLGIFRLP